MVRNSVCAWIFPGLLVLSILVLSLIYATYKTKEMIYHHNISGALLPVEGTRKGVHIDAHLEKLLNERQASLISNGDHFKRYLSSEENKWVKQCEKTAITDRSKSFQQFLRNTQICVLHHSYLKQNDTVLIEVGGNIGDDASAYSARYNSRHLILEPVPHFADKLRKKFKGNSRITVLNFGLGRRTENVNVGIIGDHGDSTSIYEKNPGNITINIINSTEFFAKIGVGIFSVDLLTMDCEGCEYDVIENLLESNMIKYFKNIQFESHGDFTDLKSKYWIKRYCMIQEYMSRTHRLTYQFKHVWDNWRRLDL